MRYRQLTPDGDMRFGAQQGDFLRDTPETVAQAVLTRLRLWTGEWFIDTTEGTPYMQAALGTDKRRTLEPAIRARILGTEGVTRIEGMDMSFEMGERTVALAATIDTAYGQAAVRGGV